MTYREVLDILGPPNSLRWAGDFTILKYHFPEGSPSTGRYRSIYFDHGKTVFCEGLNLCKNGVELHSASQPFNDFVVQLGSPESLGLFTNWFPQCGLVVENDVERMRRKPGGRVLGLRSPELLSPKNPDGDVFWDSLMVGADDFHESITVGFLELGDKGPRVRSGSTNVLYDAGYVRGFRNVQAAERRFFPGGLHLLVVSLELGKPVEVNGAKRLAPTDDLAGPHLRYRAEKGGVTDIEIYVKDDALFEALGESRR